MGEKIRKLGFRLPDKEAKEKLLRLAEIHPAKILGVLTEDGIIEEGKRIKDLEEIFKKAAVYIEKGENLLPLIKACNRSRGEKICKNAVLLLLSLLEEENISNLWVKNNSRFPFLLGKHAFLPEYYERLWVVIDKVLSVDVDVTLALTKGLITAIKERNGEVAKKFHKYASSPRGFASISWRKLLALGAYSIKRGIYKESWLALFRELKNMPEVYDMLRNASLPAKIKGKLGL